MKKIAALVLTVMITALSFAGCAGEVALQDIEKAATNDIQSENTDIEDQNSDLNLKGPYQVERVVDGDTVILNINGVSERVRLIGVDTPESVHPDAEKNVEYGKVASEYTKNALEGKSVEVEFDVQERDKYNRILAYLYLNDEMFNLKLIEEGHAKVATFPPNVKYVDEFTEAQETARSEGKGLWDYEEGTYIAEGYIGNSSTKKFHEISCSSVDSMSKENKVEFANKDEAVNAGYSACGRCKP